MREIEPAERFSPAQEKALAETIAAVLGVPLKELVSEDGSVRAAVGGPAGKRTPPAEAVRKAVFRLSGGTGTVPKARFEEILGSKTLEAG